LPGGAILFTKSLAKMMVSGKGLWPAWLKNYQIFTQKILFSAKDSGQIIKVQ